MDSISLQGVVLLIMKSESLSRSVDFWTWARGLRGTDGQHTLQDVLLSNLSLRVTPGL